MFCGLNFWIAESKGGKNAVEERKRKCFLNSETRSPMGGSYEGVLPTTYLVGVLVED